MARRVKRITDVVEYVLDIGDNRTEDDPFTVELEPISGEEMMKIERGMGKMTRGSDMNFMTRAHMTRDKIIKERVKGVRNYEVEDNAGVVFTPTNGEELLRAVKIAGASEVDLVLDDILEALKDHSKLSEGLAKNFNTQSESVSLTTNKSTAGAAKNAEGQKAQART